MKFLCSAVTISVPANFSILADLIDFVIFSIMDLYCPASFSLIWDSSIESISSILSKEAVSVEVSKFFMIFFSTAESDLEKSFSEELESELELPETSCEQAVKQKSIVKIKIILYFCLLSCCDFLDIIFTLIY